MLGVNHPVNDPTLVSYHRPELVSLLPDLELAHDCWVALNGVGAGDEELKAKYLHKEPGEPVQAYRDRLHRATYTPVYRDAIRGYAGLLGRFELIDVPPTMEDNQDNVDLNGSSIQAFLGRCDERVLRDGGVYVMVDMLPNDGADNFLDQQRDGRVPYLIMVDRSDVINWHVERVHGRQRVVRATVRQYRPSQIPNSFGTSIEPIYHVLEPGKVSTYRVDKSENGWRNVLVEEIETTIPFVPLVWYGATSTNFAVSEMPMQGLASMSLQHFQLRSDLTELLHKCAMPVPVRKGAVAGANGAMPPLVLGPNTAVDLDAEGDFKFVEPHGQSLTQHQNEIRHLEELMDRSSLNFLYGAEVKTATEASLRAAQVASQVSGMVRTKVSSFDTVMRLWALYAGEESSINPESGLAMNDSLINKPVDSSAIAQMVNLYREKLISRPTILEELRRGGVLDPDLRIDAELERIEEDRKRRQDEEVEDAEAMANVTTPAAPRQQTDQVEDLNRAAQDQQNDKEGTTAEINR
jgi:ribosomal protein L35AE/L33A